MAQDKIKNNLSTKGYTNLLGDIRRTSNYIVIIEGVMAGNNALELVVDKAFIPSLEIGVLTLTHGNDSKTFAGQASWSGGTLTINDTLNQAELDALIAWQKEVYDPSTGAIGHAEPIGIGYKKLAHITEYSGSGDFQRTWTCPVWISGLNHDNLDSSTQALKQVHAQIQVDPPQQLEPKYNY